MNPNFKEWACSLSGCDGGNPNAEIWICGIEWGLGKSAENKYYKEELPEEIEKGENLSPYETYKWKVQTNGSVYGKNIAKLYSAIKGNNFDKYLDVIKDCTDSEIFKMNLYPIAFSKTSNQDQIWREYNLKNLTGFDDKYSFETWCNLYRFPVIANWLKENTSKLPKLIIGTGISYLKEFFLLFADRSDRSKNLINCDKILPESPEKKPRRYYWAELRNGTLLFVIPFGSGAYGLHSGYLMQEMGDRIRKLIPKAI